jgi:hypothetical protein
MLSEETPARGQDVRLATSGALRCSDRLAQKMFLIVF